MYSQNEEEKYIVEFFHGKHSIDNPLCLLSIGENDGITFSNSLRLIELGWDADLVEPSPSAYDNLVKLHYDSIKDHHKIEAHKLAIGTESGTMDFHDSGTHLNNGDTSLLSTLVPQEKERWKDTEWNIIPVQVLTYADFKADKPYEYDFISIDAEGLDIAILKQIDLTHTKLLCIEWNSIEQNKIDILEYSSKFGMTKVLYQSGENLLICREQ